MIKISDEKWRFRKLREAGEMRLNNLSMIVAAFVQHLFILAESGARPNIIKEEDVAFVSWRKATTFAGF